MKVNTNIKQVIVIRKDLKMRCGKSVAQGAHGSVMGVLALPSDDKYRRTWLREGMTKITVKCDSEEELHELYNKAEELKIPVVKVTDAGLTEFDGVPTDTCIVLGPYSAEYIDQVTKNLKLL